MTRTNYTKQSNLLGSYQYPIDLPEVTVVANYPHEQITTGNKNYIKYIRSGVYGKEAK